MKEDDIRVDISRSLPYTGIVAVQGDSNSNKFNIDVYDDSLPYDFTGLTPKIIFKKKDGSEVFQDTTTGVTVVDAATGKLNVVLRPQTISYPGMISAEIQFIGPGDIKETSAIFQFYVRASLDQGAIESSNDFTPLVNALSKVEEWDQQFETKFNGLEVEYAEELTSVAASLASMTNQSVNALMSTMPINELKPVGFDWDIPVEVIRKNINSEYIMLYNGEYLDLLKHFYTTTSGVTYYVNKTTGLDTNSGLTLELPLKTVLAAINKADAETIYVAEGTYGRSFLYNNGLLPSKNIKIIGVGKVNFAMFRDTGMTYTLAPDMIKTYVATMSTIVAVWDMSYFDEYGDFKYSYAKKTTIADVEANAGSWYWDGTKFYVHTIDDRIPNYTIATIPELDTTIANSENIFYFENINFCFGNFSPFTAKGNSTPLFKNCTFKYGTKSNGFSGVGNKLSVSIDCSASKNYADGFNYHHDIATGISPNFIEIDCFGYRAGLDSPTNNNNGSTAHENVRGIRINTVAFENKGANIMDISPSKTWNIGCVAYNSKSLDDDFNIGFSFNNSWMQNCISYGNLVALSSNANDYVKNCVFMGTVIGTPTPY